MRSRAGLFPRVTEAAAGPHDLGSGQNHDSTFPELTSHSAPNVEYDVINDHEAQNLAPGGDGSHSGPCIQEKEYDEFDAITELLEKSCRLDDAIQHYPEV